jgi:hypothetical protein
LDGARDAAPASIASIGAATGNELAASVKVGICSTAGGAGATGVGGAGGGEGVAYGASPIAAAAPATAAMG